MITTLLVGLLLVGGTWLALATAPKVEPDRCWDPAVREGREECGDPCTEARPLPCAASNLDSGQV